MEPVYGRAKYLQYMAERKNRAAPGPRDPPIEQSARQPFRLRTYIGRGRARARLRPNMFYGEQNLGGGDADPFSLKGKSLAGQFDEAEGLAHRYEEQQEDNTARCMTDKRQLANRAEGAAKKEARINISVVGGYDGFGREKTSTEDQQNVPGTSRASRPGGFTARFRAALALKRAGRGQP